MEHDLIDELRLMLLGVVSGGGSAFGHESDKKRLQLVESKPVE